MDFNNHFSKNKSEILNTIMKYALCVKLWQHDFTIVKKFITYFCDLNTPKPNHAYIQLFISMIEFQIPL